MNKTGRPTCSTRNASDTASESLNTGSRKLNAEITIGSSLTLVQISWTFYKFLYQYFLKTFIQLLFKVDSASQSYKLFQSRFRKKVTFARVNAAWTVSKQLHLEISLSAFNKKRFRSWRIWYRNENIRTNELIEEPGMALPTTSIA